MQIQSFSPPLSASRPPGPPPQPPGDTASGPDGDFDFSQLNHSREMYFLPGLDRVAATLASQSQVPVQVRVEARGQFLEYTLDPKNPLAPIPGSLNGSQFTVKPEQKSDGPVEMDLVTPAGSLLGDLTTKGNTTQYAGLIYYPGDHRSIAQRITLDHSHGKGGASPPPLAPPGNVGTVIGNFACARLMESVTRGSEGLTVDGQMADYAAKAHVTVGPKGTLVNEGDLYDAKTDVHFKQTFTPQGDPGPNFTAFVHS